MEATKSLLHAALNYSSRGWSVFPLLGKLPRVKWTEYQQTAPTTDQIIKWWSDWPDAGIGIALGKVSGIIRLDADGMEALPKLTELFGPIPDTPSFSTPSGGLGWLFAYTDEESSVLWKGSNDHEELRIQSDGAYSVLPPSPHPEYSGLYTWIVDPQDCKLAAIPSKIATALREKKVAKVLRDLERELGVVNVPPPRREIVFDALQHIPPVEYEVWLQVGMALHATDTGLFDVWDNWSKGYPQKYDKSVNEKRWAGFISGAGITSRSILFLAKKYGWEQPKDPPLTDIGNSERLVSQFGSGMRYCHPWNKWLVWDSKRWALDQSGSAMQIAKDVAKKLLADTQAIFAEAAEAAEMSDAEDSQGKKKRAMKMYAHALNSQKIDRVKAALMLAQSDLPIQPESLDTSPWLLNCQNGTLNLKTRVLQPHSQSDNITKLCPTAFDESAKCPKWETFLDQVFESKTDTIKWLQKLFGYCLTGSVAEHILPVFWGCGSNGKSTLLSTLFTVMGADFAGKAPKDLLIATKQSGHPTILASLFGMRLVAAVETGDGARLDEVTVKELTGGDKIKCRRMQEDFWEYVPTHKLILATNHQPEVRGTDHAIWRRIRLVPFQVTFPDATSDKFLAEKLAAEAPGILRWMVDGCSEWMANGLGITDDVMAATKEYRAEQDRLAAFLAQYYVIESTAADGPGAHRLRKNKVREKYVVWCANNREQALNATAFGKAIRERNIKADANYYYGLKEIVEVQ